MKKIYILLLAVYIGGTFFSINAYAKNMFEVDGCCKISPNATIVIRVDTERFDGFDLYRESENGEFQYMDSIGIVRKEYEQSSEDEWGENPTFHYEESQNNYQQIWKIENKKYVEYREYTFIDDSDLEIYKTYQYRVDGYRYENDEKVIIDTKEVSVLILKKGPNITYGKRNGKLGVKIKWSKVSDADGYTIFCQKDYDEKSNYIGSDKDDYARYQIVKSVSNANTTSATFNKQMNGATYTYRICSYQWINGQKIYSTYSNAKSITMNYYSYRGETYAKKIKRAFGSEKKKQNNFKTSGKASKQMKTIKIKVWDFKTGKSGKKVTKIKYLTVNKKLAPSIQQMFKDLYNSSEKQVIKDIGAYAYRTGEHMYGMAIDVNWNENYMIDKVNGKKVIMAGSYWKPKKDPYSIPANCEFVRIMERYGFSRGDWGDRKDYMHFSYLGK